MTDTATYVTPADRLAALMTEAGLKDFTVEPSPSGIAVELKVRFNNVDVIDPAAIATLKRLGMQIPWAIATRSTVVLIPPAWLPVGTPPDEGVDQHEAYMDEEAAMNGEEYPGFPTESDLTATSSTPPIAPDPALTATAELIAELRAERDAALRDLSAAETRIEELNDERDSLLESARVANDLFVEHIEMVTAPTRKAVFVSNKISQADLETRLNDGWEILHIQFVHKDLSVVLTREVPTESAQPAHAAARIISATPLVTITPAAANDVRRVDAAIYASANIDHLPTDIIDAESPDYVQRVLDARIPTADKMDLLNKHTFGVVKAARTITPTVTYNPLPAVRHG